MITIEEFKQWVEEQPDDRPFDLTDANSSNSCGCPMVQYGREVMKLDGFYCGAISLIKSGTFIAIDEFDESPYQYVRDLLDARGIVPWGDLTYGMIKQKK